MSWIVMGWMGVDVLPASGELHGVLLRWNIYLVKLSFLVEDDVDGFSQRGQPKLGVVPI